jgi:cell pole-organizing protein PopZ
MTQPAKAQEPSMEEILASIRRIIADDEAKPAMAEKPAVSEAPKKPELARAEPPKPVAQPVAPVTRAPAMNNIAPVAKAAPPAPAPKPAAPPAPAATNSQDDIDAMLAGLGAATSEPEIRSPPPPPPPEEEVFELTDDMVLPAPPPPNPFRKVEPAEDLEFAEAVTASQRQRKSVFDPPSYDSPPVPPSQPILSRSTVSAVESAFNSLANTVLSNNARTLEDLVKEMLRPMLKSWLDDNLPGLVERIVKAEIERVSRGRQ